MGRPLRLRRRVGFKLFPGQLDGPLELRVAAGDDVAGRLLDLDVGPSACPSVDRGAGIRL
jgi:hypothetical protein